MNNESINPLASLLIITYKQEHCIVETLNSAVSQDYDNLEIVVSDDHSPDNTYKIIEEYVGNYSGPHKFIINRNEQNLRIVGNLNKAIELSHGDYLILQAGDDIAEPNRVRLSVEKLNELNVLSVTFNMKTFKNNIESSKLWTPQFVTETVYTIKDYLSGQYWACGASRAIKREIFNIFGYIDDTCPTEDSVINLRSFLTGGLGYCPITTLYYRWDGNNSSAPSNSLIRIDPVKIYNQYMKDINTALEKHIINIKEHTSIQKHIEVYLVREKCIRKIYKQKTLLNRLFTFIPILFSTSLSFQTKKIFLQRIISWHKENIYYYSEIKQ